MVEGQPTPTFYAIVRDYAGEQQAIPFYGGPNIFIDRKHLPTGVNPGNLVQEGNWRRAQVNIDVVEIDERETLTLRARGRKDPVLETANGFELATAQPAFKMPIAMVVGNDEIHADIVHRSSPLLTREKPAPIPRRNVPPVVLQIDVPGDRRLMKIATPTHVELIRTPDVIIDGRHRIPYAIEKQVQFVMDDTFRHSVSAARVIWTRQGLVIAPELVRDAIYEDVILPTLWYATRRSFDTKLHVFYLDSMMDRTYGQLVQPAAYEQRHFHEM